MKWLSLVAVAAALVFCPLSVPEGQAAVEALTLRDLSDRSPLILKGRITASEVKWVHNEFGEVIVTDYRVRVDETLKGSVHGGVKDLTLRCMGGRIGNTEMRTAVEPSVESGESTVLFLWQHPEAEAGIYQTYGGFQGKYTILGDRVREARDQTWAQLRTEILGHVAAAKKK